MYNTRFGFTRGFGFVFDLVEPDGVALALLFDLETTGFLVTLFFTFLRADDLPLFVTLRGPNTGVSFAANERTLALYTMHMEYGQNIESSFVSKW